MSGFTDPNKKKFKKGVFKVNHPIYRHNAHYVRDLFYEILVKHMKIIKYINWEYDYESTTGVHINMTFQSSSYKTLLKLYKNDNDSKDPRVFWFMKDIEDTDQFIDWISYISMRKNTNYKKYQACIKDPDNTAQITF